MEASNAVFAAAHAGRPGASWRMLVDDCVRQLGPLGGRATMGFVYVSDALADHLAEIIAALRQATSARDWVGSVAIGVLGGGREYFDEPALAMLVAGWPPEMHRLIPNLGAGADLGRLRDWASVHHPMLAVVHGDPRASHVPDAMERLAQDASLFLVGGLSSAQNAAMRQIAGDVVSGGLSGVMLAPEIGVAAGLSQGCSPVGPVRTITAARENVVFEIDGRPALDVLKEDIGELLSRQLARIGGYIHAAFPVRGADTADYLVRNLTALDPVRGWVAVGALVTPGDRILFVRRDRDAAARDLGRMLDELKRRIGGPPRAGLYFSCLARGPNLFGPDSEEVAMVRAALGDFPLAGMFCNGEICNDRLYGYTGVLALFT